MIQRIVVPVLFLTLCCCGLWAQQEAPLSDGALNAVSERGRLLAEYDQAAWHASDALRALRPPQGSVTGYVAKKTGDDWTVCFGRLNELRDKYICVYEVTNPLTAETAKATKLDPPREDGGFFLFAALALETAHKNSSGQQRPYNFSVIPANPMQMYVYVVPAQTDNDIFPLGGDVRYLISGGGLKVVEKRQLHKSILEFRNQADATAGYHTHVLSDVPEDTDVFYVLARAWRSPEYVVTQKYMYIVETTGKITFMGETDKVLKLLNKVNEEQKTKSPPSNTGGRIPQK